MIVAIPHQTQQLILAAEQKKILREQNSSSLRETKSNESNFNSVCYVPEFPLWIKFDSSSIEIEKFFDTDFFKNKNEKLKSLRKKLKPISIYNWQEKNGKLFFPTEINFDDKLIYGKITFGKKICVTNAENHQSTIGNCKLSIVNSELLIACKIFRIALAEFETSENDVASWRVNDFVWIKT